MYINNMFSRVMDKLESRFPAFDFRNTWYVIIINMALALTAFGKDVFLAAYLGTSANADVFLLTYFLIDTVGNNLMAAALGAACLPVFARWHTQGDRAALIRTVRATVLFSLMLVGLIIMLLWGWRVPVLTWLGGGWPHPVMALGVQVLSIILPLLLLFPLIAIGTSVLQVHNRFVIPALAPVFFNLVFLLGVMGLYFARISAGGGVIWLGVILVISGLTMMGIIWVPILKSDHMDFRRYKGGSRQGLALVRQHFWPYFSVVLSTQIIYVVERYLASWQGVGNVAALNYAFRLVQFPIWVFVAAVSAVMFPAMARTYAAGDLSKFRNLVQKSGLVAAAFTVPLTLILFGWRQPIVAILFKRGAFGTYSVRVTAVIMAGYTLTIVWQGISAIAQRALLAMGRTGYAALGAWLALLVNVTFDLAMVPRIGVAGIGYGAALGSGLNAVLLIFFFRRALKRESGDFRGSSSS